jgi:N6-L-threonylcarbamoyladenine synthase
VGLAAAKGLALRLGKPLCAVHHLEAHIYSVFLAPGAPRPEEALPCVALVVSGGHTSLVRVEALGRYRVLGQTIDDAAGEAFDKGANLLGLGYPGGPVMDKRAREGDPRRHRFPRGRQRRETMPLPDLDPALCFSFSGLKTALLYRLKDHPLSGDAQEMADLVASYQEAIVDALVDRTRRALRGERCLAVCGGVSLNSRLRAKLTDLAGKLGVRLLLAIPAHCADNAAMVAGLASAGHGIWGEPALAMDAEPDAPIGAHLP